MEPIDVRTLGDVASGLPVSAILWSVLGLLTVIFSVYSALLMWHWREYSTGKYTTLANMVVYLSVGCGFIILMVLATLWYSLV